MARTSHALLATAATVALLTTAGGAVAPPIAPLSPADEKATIVHVLNRVAFGPRPGDIETIESSLEVPLDVEGFGRGLAAPR